MRISVPLVVSDGVVHKHRFEGVIEEAYIFVGWRTQIQIIEGIFFGFYQETHWHTVDTHRLCSIGKRLCNMHSLGAPGIEPKTRGERSPPLMLPQKNLFLALREEKGDPRV